MVGRRHRADDEDGLGDNPLADAPAVDPLAEAFYGARDAAQAAPPAAAPGTPAVGWGARRPWGGLESAPNYEEPR